LRPDGQEMTDEEWNTGWVRSLALRLSGVHLDMVDESGDPLADQTVLILLNAHHEAVSFTRAEVDAETEWELGFDTAQPNEHGRAWTFGEPYELQARTLAVFVEGAADKEPTNPAQ